MAEFTRFPMPREQVLSCGTTTVGVIPELSLVSHFQVNTWPVLYRPSETGNVKRWGLPLMIPNFARLKDGRFLEKDTTLPMHGFGRDLPWSILQKDQTSIIIQLTSNETTRANYPYDFTFTVAIVVSEGALTYTLTMENRDAAVMPIAPGFHPYFTIAQQDKARLLVNGLDGFDASSVLWDTQPPDQHFPFPHQVTINFPSTGTLTITELPSAGKYSLAEMQVWSEPASAPDHAFVCLEPIVTHADGLNRPEDRINIPPHSSHQIVWQLVAQPIS